ncbi:MAG: phosphoribosyltransferase family protein [Candidatus Woesearchaeota archaeon]
MDLDRIDTETKVRYDVTPLFHDSAVFSELVEELAAPFVGKVDVVVGLEALGFILGSAVAFRLDAGFAPIRKAGKLPVDESKKRTVSFTDYTKTEKSFEIRIDAIASDARVLIVDDWIETGEQVRAAIELVTHAGASVEGVSVIGADRTPRTQDLFDRFDVHVLRS